MMNKVLMAVLAVAVFVGLSSGMPNHNGTPATGRIALLSPAQPFSGVDPNEDLGIKGDSPDGPRRDVGIGDPRGVAAIGNDYLIGYTYYDYQHNGSCGKMLAKDSQGNIHFTWMCGYTSNLAGDRHQVYNYLSNGDLMNGANQHGYVDNGTRSGYGALALLPADERAAIFYHVLGYDGAPANDWVSWAMGVDFFAGIGAFSSTYPPTWAQTQIIWPKGAFGADNVAHIIGHEYKAPNGDLFARVAYSRGEPDQDFVNWSWYDAPVDIDTTAVISEIAAASVTSNKVVLAWHHNRVGADLGAWANFGGAYQKNNDLRYIVSDDGENWDWEHGIKSITKIVPPSPELADDPEKAVGDTFRPYCDADIEFDPWGDDNLYASFSTVGIWEAPIPDPDPVTGATGEHGHLWFWNSVEDTITLIYDGWYFNRRPADGISRCGGWRMNCDRSSIAFNPEDPGTIYVVWVNFPKIMEPVYNDDGTFKEWHFLEGAQDTSDLGFSNAEIMVSISTDYGITWREPIDITQTRWEGDQAPEPGDCMSENWPSVAYLADDTLHIQYIFDLEAGGTAQPNEGDPTKNPVVYQRIAISDLPLNDPVAMPRDEFMFHNYPESRLRITSVDRAVAAPVDNDAVTVTATLVPGAVAIDSVTLVYRIITADTSDGSLTMTPGQQNNTYVADIPGQEDGTQVWYKIVAVNQEGTTVQSPLERENWWFAYTVRPQGGLTIYDVQYHAPNWGVDYSPYRGYEVTVKGTVTTPNDFAVTYGGYAIEDTSSTWNGVIVRGITDELNVGDYIAVTGTVMEHDSTDATKWQFATYISTANNYQLLGQHNVPASIDVDSVAFLTFSRGAEALEATLIRLPHKFMVSSVADAATGYYQIQDNRGTAWLTSIGLTDQDKSELGDWAGGTEIRDCVGILTENNGHYAIAPRTLDDIGPLSVKDDGSAQPREFALEAVYPNPFNSATTIAFDLNRTGLAQLGIYDLGGRLVTNVVNDVVKAGHYEMRIDASSLPAGVYIVRLASGAQNASRKLVLLK